MAQRSCRALPGMSRTASPCAGFRNGRGDEMARHRRQSPGDEGGVGEGCDANRSVISVANEIDVRLSTSGERTDADECRIFLSMLGIGPAKLDT